MDVSPKMLRDVEFREKMRGYHPEDVDQFLEQVAAGVEVLQDRLRQAVERAQRAEAAAAEAGDSDETLRKTLVLAQRTADLPLAVAAYSHAEQLHPTDYGYLLLAGALDANGQKQKAGAARQQAALLSNNILEAQRNADQLLSR